ncbi:MAG: hypothetical protein CVV46_09290 [Spirochaetae bacterium HGW-Spirochaetae-2]|jgi:hypothetical protein|nr:MAG: hypothetical protein CVV46_09290 [Spirochaetae bacterium HGW-Spirochaetae-2]
MRKYLLFCFLLLSGALLFAASSQDNDQTEIKLSVTEFGYPFIPSTSQVVIEVPIQMHREVGKITEIKIDAWYRALSPYFLPTTFFEVGVVPSINLLREGKFKLYLGLGTAYSQTSEAVSIPLIVPLVFRYAPLDVLELKVSIQNMIYGEGVISELILSSIIGPLFENFFIELGGSANIAYSWEEQYFQYSYGLLFGLGCRF